MVNPHLTIRDLQKAIALVHPNDMDKRLRVVFHGNDEYDFSFNKSVSAMREGANHDFIFIVEGDKK